MGSKAGTRSVALVFSAKDVLEVRSHKGELLRQIDLGSRDVIELIVPSDGKHIIIKNPKEYDAVFLFDGKYFCQAYVNLLTNKLVPHHIYYMVIYYSPKKDYIKCIFSPIGLEIKWRSVIRAKVCIVL